MYIISATHRICSLGELAKVPFAISEKEFFLKFLLQTIEIKYIRKNTPWLLIPNYEAVRTRSDGKGDHFTEPKISENCIELEEKNENTSGKKSLNMSQSSLSIRYTVYVYPRVPTTANMTSWKTEKVIHQKTKI